MVAIKPHARIFTGLRVILRGYCIRYDVVNLTRERNPQETDDQLRYIPVQRKTFHSFYSFICVPPNARSTNSFTRVPVQRNTLLPSLPSYAT